LKFTFFLSGLILFFFLAYTVLHTILPEWSNNDVKVLILLGISAIFGIMGAFLFFCVSKIGVFSIGFLGGVTIASIAYIPLHNFFTAQWMTLLFLIGVGIVVGVVGIFAEKIIMIIGVSLFGSNIIAFIIDFNWIKSRYSDIYHINMLQFIKIEPTAYFVLSGVIVLAVAGIIFQFAGPNKYHDHNKKPEDRNYRYSSLNGHKMRSVV